MTVMVLHVTRAFSAQPTLGELLDDVRVIELPLAEALANLDLDPDLVWVSEANRDALRAVRRQFPRAPLLATPRRGATPEDRVALIPEADLVLTDEGVVLAAAGLQALSRRLATA
ncbi:MAG TPA: hypothetical protein VI248_13055 [Kineosporiaceae bacterium]